MGRPPKNITVDDIETFKIDYVNPVLSEQDLVTKYKVSLHYLDKQAKQLNLVREKRRGCTKFVTGNLSIDIVIEYLDGATCRGLAKKYGCSFPTISAFLKEHGICVKTNVETVTRYELNKDYFMNIDTPEKAYFLGFIAADGYITKKHQAVVITLKEDDVAVLEAFKAAIGYTGSITDRRMRIVNTDTWVNRKSIVITNKQFVSHLISLGVVNRKSLVLQWPNIPTHLEGAMLLGLSDGDGSVYRSNGYWGWSLVGSYDVVETTKARLRTVGLGDNKIEKKENIFSIGYNGYNNLKKIYAYMYENHGFCLKRKKDRFLACFAENEENPEKPEAIKENQNPHLTTHIKQGKFI
jgi:hypothetical protein